jgi:hypothetical protein
MPAVSAVLVLDQGTGLVARPHVGAKDLVAGRAQLRVDQRADDLGLLVALTLAVVISRIGHR